MSFVVDTAKTVAVQVEGSRSAATKDQGPTSFGGSSAYGSLEVYAQIDPVLVSVG